MCNNLFYRNWNSYYYSLIKNLYMWKNKNKNGDSIVSIIDTEIGKDIYL